MNQHTSQVSVPAAYFRKSLREYRNWRFAMVREFIQNSYDALATAIKFSVEPRGNNVVIRCSDNGTGMTREVLTDVFLCLGGSKKEDGAIGGFGYAKTILAFAHQEYSIMTNDLIVTGSGGSYTITQNTVTQPIKGTVFEVVLEATDSFTVEEWCKQIRLYSALSSINQMNERQVTISLNGAECKQNNVDNDFEYSNEFGKCLYKASSGDVSTVVVSIRGLPMFIEQTWSGSEQAVSARLELAGTSFDNLTANRDGFTGSLSSRFSSFMKTLADNYKKDRFGHSVDFEINRTGDWSEGERFADSSLDVMNGITQYEETSAEEKQMMAVLDKVDFSRYPDNFQLKVSSFAGRRGAKAEVYVSSAELVADMKTKRNRVLAYHWQASICLCLSTEWARKNGIVAYSAPGQIVEDFDTVEDVTALQFYFNGARVVTGFAYVPGAEALCSTSYTKVALTVNPDVFMREDWFYGDMIDAALHECAHIWEMAHSERFTTIESQLRRSMRRMITEKELDKVLEAVGKSVK